jgi:hypothetical protein
MYLLRFVIVCFYILKVFLKEFKFFLLQIKIFLVFLDHFDTLISKIILKNKNKYYFDIF